MGVATTLAVVAAVGAVYSASEQRKAGKKAEKIAEENAQAQEAEAAEGLRRKTLDDNRIRGVAAARMAASGITSEGTAGNVLSSMEVEQGKQTAWSQLASKSRASIIRSEGSLAKKSAYGQSIGTATSAFSSMAGYVK